MTRLVRPLVALVLVCTAAPVLAQTPTTPPAGARPGGMPGGPQQGGGTIRGTVVDEAGAPVARASVSVWSAADSALVTGAVAGANGQFRVEGLRPGRYYVKASSLGHRTTSTSVLALSPQTPVADAGTIRLAAGAVQLDAIEVTAERATAGFSADRNTYRAADLQATGGTATDVLRNVPALEVDGDGKVSLRGNENVAVQINGRPAPMRGDQLANFLQQLPANVVESVEVIPNPSAKYEPEGMAGIVNIVLKQNTDLGLSGGLMVGAGTGDKYNGSGNLGYQKGPLTLYGSYGFRQEQRQSSGENYREVFGTTSSDPLSYLQQDILGQQRMQTHMLNGTADLRLGKTDVLSTNLMLMAGEFRIANDNWYLESDAAQSPTRRYLGETRNAMDDLNFDGSLAYRRTLQPQRNVLSAELRFNRQENDHLSGLAQQLLTDAGAPANDEPLRENNTVEALNRTFTAQLDYTRAFGERTRLETGYKGTLRLLDNETSVDAFDYDQDAWVDVAGRDNAFEYNENVNAGYAVLSQGVGRFDVQAGFRAERTDREFTLANTGEAFPKEYWSFFPSGLVSLNLDDRTQVKASYSKRIQRPDTRLLNPFGFYEDQLSRMQGNPELEPEYMHSLELGFQRSFALGSLQATPFFRRSENAVRRIREMHGDTAVWTFRNLQNSDQVGVDLNGSLRAGPLSGFMGFSAFRSSSEGVVNGQDIGTEAVGWSVRANATWKVTPRLDLQGMVMYRAPQDVEQGRMSAMRMSSISLRHKLMGEKASLNLRVMDPFNTMGFTSRTNDGTIYQLNQRKFGARAAYLTFSYNFGQQPKIRPQPQPEQQQDPQQIPGTMPGR